MGLQLGLGGYVDLGTMSDGERQRERANAKRMLRKKGGKLLCLVFFFGTEYCICLYIV